MTLSYGGPLFQLYNGSATLDIGQTSNKQADMSTWSAFCGGTASNCVVSKIYAQIQGHANDLIPSVFNAPFGPNCSTGGAYQCAAPFTIEVATSLPYLSTTAPQEYTLSGDQSATGVNGGTGSISVVYNGKSLTQGVCCGQFGIAHKYNAGDISGTDFMLGIGYGQPSSGLRCQTTTTYCIGIDEEQGGSGNDQGDYGSSIINLEAFVTFSSGTNTVTAQVNSHSIFNNSPPAATIDAGLSIHLGGGGDLSQPAPVYMREGMIINGALSGAQQTSILNNVTAFPGYSALSFP